MTEQNVKLTTEPADENVSINKRIRQAAWIVIAVVVTFLLGLGSGYLKWGQDETAEAKRQKELTALHEQVNPKDGYALSVAYGKLGPQLVEAGVIDYGAFMNVMKSSGDPISDRQTDILKKGSDDPIVINAENAHFLLNFFWAVGLANRNSILTKGSMVQYRMGKLSDLHQPAGGLLQPNQLLNCTPAWI